MTRPRIGPWAGWLMLLALAAIAVTAPAAENETAGRLDLGEYRGKVVLVDFWASWCVPCRRSFPWLEEMQARYAQDGFVVIGVNVDSSPADAKAFLEEYPVSFRIVEDRKGGLAGEFDVIAMPSSYLFDRDGELVARHLGFKVRKTDEYEAAIRRSLAL